MPPLIPTPLRRFTPFLPGLLLVLAATLDLGQANSTLQILRAGNRTDVITAPIPGFALMGGGKDLDEAFRWLCEHANGGDFVILRASGDDAYNPYVQHLCSLNSVTTLIIPSRAAAADPAAARSIAHAEALFIAGGDQANYIDFWKNTPVQEAINDAIRFGVPLGGTSAGLAVLGEWSYSAQGDKPDEPNLNSALALTDPYGPRITLVHRFLDIPQLKGIITDSHFARRDRMGRLLAFLARLDSGSAARVRGIGVDVGAAVLLDPAGNAEVIGRGAAWFVSPAPDYIHFPPAPALTAGPFQVDRVTPGQRFDTAHWNGNGKPYWLKVQRGHLRSTPPRSSIY